MSIYCDHCKRETEEVTVDASFDYAGTHCTGGLPGTELVFFKASECCEEEGMSEGIFVMCKCGEELEIHPDRELEWVVCPACDRMGKFSTEY